MHQCHMTRGDAVPAVPMPVVQKPCLAHLDHVLDMSLLVDSESTDYTPRMSPRDACRPSPELTTLQHWSGAAGPTPAVLQLETSETSPASTTQLFAKRDLEFEQAKEAAMLAKSKMLCESSRPRCVVC